jgi:hypothetical protein
MTFPVLRTIVAAGVFTLSFNAFAADKSEHIELVRDGEVLKSSPAFFSQLGADARAKLERHIAKANPKSWNKERNCLEVKGAGDSNKFLDSESCLKLDAIGSSDGVTYFVMKGQASDSDGTPRDCHGCPGVFIIGSAKDPTNADPAGQLTLSEVLVAGAWGSPPQRFEMLNFGPNNQVAVLYEGGFTQGGNVEKWVAIATIVGSKATELLTGLVLNLGAGEPCDSKDENYECQQGLVRSITISVSPRQSYPDLIVERKKQFFRKDKVVKEDLLGRQIVKFDQRGQTYALPELTE